MDYDAETKPLFREVPWLYLPAVKLEDFLCERYADDDGELLGMVPIAAFFTWGWRYRFTRETHQLVCRRRMKQNDVARELSRQANVVLSRLWRTAPIPV